MSVDDGLRAIFRQHVVSFDWTTVETGMTQLGVPDSNYCARGGPEGWIEYKATDGWAVTMRPEQVGWISRRVRWGGRVHIAVRRRHDGGPRRGPPVDELYVMPGALVVALCDGGLLCPLVVKASRRWSGGPAKWDWDAVVAVLTAGPRPRGTRPRAA